MRKFLCTLLTVCLLLGSVSLAEQTADTELTIPEPADALSLAVSPVTETIRIGKAVLLSFTVPEEGDVDLVVETSRGEEVSVVVLGYEAMPGVNQVYWNGTYGGFPAPQGEYQLVLSMADERAATPVVIGPQAPYLNNIQAASNVVTPDEPLYVSFYAGCAGRISTGLWLNSQWRQLASWAVNEGENTLLWDANELTADGEIVYTLQLIDAEGVTSTEEHLTLIAEGFGDGEAAPETDPEDDLLPDDEVILEPEDSSQLGLHPEYDADQAKYTPSYGSPYTGQDKAMNYWTLPMDITNESAVWEMLMQPMTVLDNGKKNAERTQEIVYQEPSKSSKGLGVVTCLTQGVHVLEKGAEWTLIEAYSSSFHDSAVKNWNTLVQGYVPTKYLKTIKPDASMAMVIDKLTQRMYVFRDGALYDTLLISTGVANERQPYNETRSGEFLLQNPAVGQFRSDNLYCDMGIRFNSGDLLHELPHTLLKDGGRNYTGAEPKLGTRASHGCVRVQRLRTPKGTNMNWIWNKRHDEMKLVIWEDWQGRVYPYPDDETILYYNPAGGNMYHTTATCYSAPKASFDQFTYGDLDSGEFAELTRCKYCAPPLRKAEIDAINENYLPGGDHDPIITAARQKAWKSMGLLDDDE